jgi:hypothetical protein
VRRFVKAARSSICGSIFLNSYCLLVTYSSAVSKIIGVEVPEVTKAKFKSAALLEPNELYFGQHGTFRHSIDKTLGSLLP